MKRLLYSLVVAALVALYSSQTLAVTLYIGDPDGFGFGNAESLQGADGKPAERTGDRSILDVGDFLPDHNRDGRLANGSGDNFDLRSVEELGDFQNTGIKWTDVSLSSSYAGRPGLAGDAVFVFRFPPPVPGDSDHGRDHFISLVFADYDVTPMIVIVDGRSLELTGNERGGNDGYIWSAYTTVSWDNIKDGEVVVEIKADTEPYVAFDYAYLGTKKLTTGVTGQTPASWAALLLKE